MTHLNIQQNTTGIEEVTHSIIEKLYNIAVSGTLDMSSNIQGRLHTSVAYRHQINYLTTNYPNLYISSDDYYINFVDSEVKRILVANGASSDNIGITESDAANFNLGQEFKGNTTITSFGEYGKFTTANTTVADANHACKFQDCTNLTSVDMSKITVMNGDDFRNTAITTINAPMISSIGYNYGVRWSYANKSLTTVASLGSVPGIPGSCFDGCSNLTTVNIPETCTYIGECAFYNCTSLQNINFPQNLTSIDNQAFYNCKGIFANGILDLTNTNISFLGAGVFRNCGLTKIYLPTTLTTFGRPAAYGVFSGNNITEIKGLDNVTTLNSTVPVSNLTNALYMGELLTCSTFPIVATEGKARVNVPHMYFPKFEHCDITQYKTVRGELDRSLTSDRINPDGSETISIGLIYFRDISYFNFFDFYGGRFKNIVINKVNPPQLGNATYTQDVSQLSDYNTWSDKLFGDNYGSGTNNIYIYVPDSAVSAYKADSKYNIYTIRGINEVDPDTNQPYLTRYATSDLWEAAGKPDDALIEEYM